MAIYHSVTSVNLFIIGLLIAQKRHEAEIYLFSNDIQECYMAEFLKETMNCAVLDSSCSRTVELFM